MMAFNRTQSKKPLKILACWLALAVGAACLPNTVSRQLKDRGRLLLAPGQRIAWAALKSLWRWGLVWQHRGDTAEELVATRDQVRRLEELNTALRARVARNEFNMSTKTEQPAPLLEARAVETRVLGEQAQSFLQHLAVVTTSAASQLTPESLAIDGGAVLIDQGDNASLTASNLAIAGGRVWGKLVEVGPQTATVRRITSLGYRGLVQIANGQNGAERTVARGVLEGSGDGLCRIRMVDATSPVAVGDLVLAAEEEGITDAPLVYGRIARTALEPGAAHWQIWMTPAIAEDVPTTLTVLQPAIHDERLVRRPKKALGVRR
jgi:cell shape-determining protein MreC